MQTITNNYTSKQSPPVVGENHQQTHIEYININLIKPDKNQPRTSFNSESIEELATSIKNYGIIQPIVVTPINNNQYKIIAGERRWRASVKIGLQEVPCIIREEESHSNLEIALIENIQREELSPVEEARAYERLMGEHNYSHEELAERLGKQRSTIANSIRLLSLPEQILLAIESKEITAGHARAICALESDEQKLEALSEVIKRALSVRQTEILVRNMKKPLKQKDTAKKIPSDLRDLCDQFKGHLGTKVRISGDQDQGKIEISYYSFDDLERISEVIFGDPIKNKLIN